MKCQKCGKNEVSFYYSSNINGAVAETHLCSECANGSDNDFARAFDMTSLFDGLFGDCGTPFGRRGMFRPLLLPESMFGYGPATSGFRPGSGIREISGCGCGERRDAGQNDADCAKVDAEMLKRREACIIREQMRLAADKEEYEEAAKLRDKLREFEADGSQG